MAQLEEPAADPAPEGPAPVRVAGLGSSAGGLEALTDVLRGLPPELPIAYVVAQHMDPTHQTGLVSLLARETGLQVVLAVDGMRLRSGTVIVAPPHHDIRVGQSTVTVEDSSDHPGPSPSVDVLLRSLADSWGDRAVAIILSGTGSDGTQGLRAVARGGGMTMVQDPVTALFPGMPDSAVKTGAVDLVLPPAAMGAALSRAVSPSGLERTRTPATAILPLGPSAEADLLRAIGVAVHAKTGLDFTDYKESTFRRQVERRLAITGVASLEEYLALVRLDAPEAGVFARSMQIGVTAFFRDPEEWEALRGPLAEHIARLEPDQQIRVWVVGCSTGEEAYTVAMLVADLLGNPANLSTRLKVFATDLFEPALDVARRGVYPTDDVPSVPEVMRQRWLRQGVRGWEITSELREVVVFARHNIVADPGFPRVDLITCRNLLIYFRPTLQDRVISLCHQSVTTGGLLMLGSSERLTANLDLFTPIDPKHRIFRSLASTRRGVAPMTWTSRPAEPYSNATNALLARRAALRDALVHRFAPPSLVIDADQRVVEVVGDVSPWCWVAEGQPTSHVLGLLREGLRPVVRAMLAEARTGATVERDLRGPGGPVRIGVHGLSPDAAGLAVVSFSAIEEGEGSTGSTIDANSRSETSTDEELESTRLALQATIEELGVSNEELQALNEELQASSEELQASSEEVQASYEELEVTNEELAVLNAELQGRSEDLSRANLDLQNIQASLTSGLILLDRDLRITRFTPLSVRLFPLIAADLGRQLTAISPVLPVPGIVESLRTALEDQNPSITEVSGSSSDFLVQFQPYVGSTGEVLGAIVVVTDISELAEARRRGRHLVRVLTTSTDSLDEVLWHRDASGRLTFLNAAVETVFGLDRERVLADPSLLLTAVHPDERDRVATFSASADPERSLTYRIVRPDGEVRWVSETAARIAAEGAEPEFVVGTTRDVTDRLVAERQARRGEARVSSMTENQIAGYLALDRTGLIIEVNATMLEMSGYEQQSLIGRPALSLLVPDASSDDAGTDAGSDTSDTSDFAEGVTPRMLIARTGERYHVTVDTRLLAPSTDDPAVRILSVHQLDRLRALSIESAANDPFDRETGLMTRTRFRSRVSDEFARYARSGKAFAVLWLDLDGFKQVNDAFGHQVGDLVLAETARRLLTTARRQDSVGRLGGDEFAILVTDMDEFDDLDSVTERFLSAIREPIAVAEAMVYVSGSVGVALAPVDGADPNSLLHSADTAMYASKAAGRDRRTYFQPAMNEASEQRAATRQRLTTAIRNRSFSIAYQPLVELATGAVHGVECLLRWEDGSTSVPAVEFIDIAVETGQIRALGRIALDLIDTDMAGTEGISALDGLNIAINLSADELSERDTFEWLASWDPPRGGYDRVTVEVTETVILRRGSRGLETVSLLRRLGAALSIDDFGIGYSNLALLGELSPDIIKIDRSLLESAGTDARGKDLLDASVRMARAFGASVVLEGVETAEQDRLARELGVDLVQGYYRARPMRLAALATWLEQHRSSPGSS